MTVTDQMENKYGSVSKALRTHVAEGLTLVDMAHKYGCSDNFIGRIFRKHGVVYQLDGRKIKKAPQGKWADMKPFERMISEHGSIKAALEACIAEGMNRPAIAKKYGCTRESVNGFAWRNGVSLPPTTREDYAHAAEGGNDAASRKAMTAAMISGEELSRIRLMEQVTIIKRGDPQFDAVAADIMRQRETCNRQAFTEKLYRE